MAQMSVHEVTFLKSMLADIVQHDADSFVSYESIFKRALAIEAARNYLANN